MKDVEVVIKISDTDYERLIASNGFSPTALKEFCKAVKNGKVLPKGHTRLFDERDIVSGNYKIIAGRIYELEPVIEADREE